MKKFHDALKTIYGPKSSGATTLLSADGNTLLTDKKKVQVGKDQEKKKLSWKGGQNTSIVCLIDHQASIRMQSTDFHR